MKKKLLLAVDDSTSAACAVGYAAELSACMPHLAFALCMVQPSVSTYITDEAKINIQAKIALDQLQRRNAENASKTLEVHRARMLRLGISPDRIQLRTVPRMVGVAEDILAIGLDGLYDALVVGRRGLSRLEQIFTGSVTANLLEHGGGIPLWVVDGNVSPAKILAAVDGSESSLRAIDHLAFIIAENPRLTVNMAHVLPAAEDIQGMNTEINLEEVIHRRRQQQLADFYAKARQIFQRAGVGDERLSVTEISSRKNVGKALLQAADEGGCSTIVVGRRNIKKSVFMGSVSRFIIRGADNKAVWLVA